MNETINIIRSRRSIRQFQERQISDLELHTIMDCAILAPNAMNQQKWHFSVIQNKDFIKRMVDITRENMLNSGIEFLAGRAKDPNFSPYFNAPTIIFVTAEQKTRFTEIDASLASQNILIAAEALGIGSHIMTSTEFLFTSENGKALAKEMGVPEGYTHVCAITLGYCEGERPVARPRNKEAVTYVK